MVRQHPRADRRGQPPADPHHARPPTAAARSRARATSSTARASAASRPTGHDIEIPLKYGVDQCVGDTICAGGILYGQRNIPVILDFCRDIREVAETGARFLNYANPMAMNTWAAIDYGKVDTIGLCHGIQHGGEQIAAVLGAGPGRARLRLLRHQPPDLVHRRPPPRAPGRPRRAASPPSSGIRSIRSRRRCGSTS